MINYHFNDELKLLRELATEFAQANPALAPLLGENKTDPDVERLLEAVAFQNSMLRRKLELDFPELIHKLTQLILPHYLRPIPATTIIGFSTKTTEGQSTLIPAGTQFASAPVDGTICRFSTTCDVQIHPLELSNAVFVQHSGLSGEIRLSLTLKGLPLSRWQPGKLRFFLSGDNASATELYLLLSRHVTRIILTPATGGAALILPPGCLEPAGFAEGEELFPYPPHAFPAYRLLQEYLYAPEKFLFFDLAGWEFWEHRGEGTEFTLRFELDSLPSDPQRVRRESIALNAVPAVNLFSHDADPISVNHRVGRYLVCPAGENPAHCRAFSVDRVTGYSRATDQERSYARFELFSCESLTEPAYHVLPEKSPTGDGYDLHLSIAFPGEIPLPDTEILSLALTCTNGRLPENLRIGDISKPLSPLPEFVSARNITPINPGQRPPLGSGLLRQLTSHLYLNQLSIGTTANLQTLFDLYLFADSSSSATANLKRISGIEAIEVTPGEELISGIPLRGSEILLKIRQDHFAGQGDMYLFGCVLDHFLGSYASVNTYTRLVFYKALKGGSWQWPTRLGKQSLQ